MDYIQRELERKAYVLADGKIPQQLFADYKAKRVSEAYGAYPSSCCGQAAFSDLSAILPDELRSDLIEGIEAFGRKVKGYDRPDAILSAMESRTSSPVRILRNDVLESSIHGLYPCGEGAGYAGGITSAAADGIRCAQALMHRFAPV